VGPFNYSKMKNLLIICCVLSFQYIDAQNDIKSKASKKMQVAVWDTYVTKKDGSIMHFDIIAPSEIKDTKIIYNYGKKYLTTKGQDGQPLSSIECRFCHNESVQPSWEAEIIQNGYFIIEMEGCE